MAAPTETSDLGTLKSSTLTEGTALTTDFMGIWRGTAGSQTLHDITLENLVDFVDAEITLALGGLSNVTEDTSTDNDLLVYVTDHWENQTLAEAGIQPLDADLTAIAALAKTDGNFIVGNGSAWVAESGATARTSLGAAALGANTFTGTQDLDGQSITMGGGLLDAEGGEIKGFVNDVVSVDTTSADVTLTAAAHGGAVILASGGATNQVIVPTTAGFTCTIIAGSAIQVEFNSTTIDTNLASGDILAVVVEDSTTIHAVKTAAADKETFS